MNRSIAGVPSEKISSTSISKSNALLQLHRERDLLFARTVPLSHRAEPPSDPLPPEIVRWTSERDLLRSYLTQSRYQNLRLLNLEPWFALARIAFPVEGPSKEFYQLFQLHKIFASSQAYFDGSHAFVAVEHSTDRLFSYQRADAHADLEIESSQPLNVFLTVSNSFLLAQATLISQSSEVYTYRFLTPDGEDLFSFPNRMWPHSWSYLRIEPKGLRVTIRQRTVFLHPELIYPLRVIDHHVIPWPTPRPEGWICNADRTTFYPPLVSCSLPFFTDLQREVEKFASVRCRYLLLGFVSYVFDLEEGCYHAIGTISDVWRDLRTQETIERSVEESLLCYMT